MKQVTILILIVGLFLVFLAACNQSVSLQEPPATEPTQAPTEPTTPPTEPADTTPTEPGQREIPWDVPETEPAPSYEDYFAETIIYIEQRQDAVGETYNYANNDLRDSIYTYKLTYEAPHLYVERCKYSENERLWEVAEIPDLQIMVYDERWIYAIEGGTDLFRMDYFGENRQLLFRDESGLISQLQNRIIVADEKVAFFMAGNAEGGASIYRLYLPEMKLDVMYHYDEEAFEAFYFATPYSREELTGQTPVEADYNIGSVQPYSNHEVLWYSANREFYELLVEKAADPQWYEAHFGNLEVPLDMCIGSVESEYQCWQRIDHYYNALTDTYRTVETGVFTEMQMFYPWWEAQ